MRMGSLFAGIGGFDIAADRAGINVAWQCESDEAARAVLEHHWPDTKRYNDVRDMEIGRYPNAPAVDVLCGGFPCQDYSVAGNREGLAGDRGALWWEFHRLIDEGRPTWVVGENVPGLFSSRGGRDFATIIDSLVALGYGVTWAVLDAQWHNVAQRRERLFIVGHSGGQPRPEILALEQGMFGHPRPSREAGPPVAPLTANGAGGGTGADVRDAQAGHLIAFAANQRDEVRDLNGVAGALAANPGIKQQTYVAYSVTPESGQGADLRATEIDTAPALTETMAKNHDRGVRLAAPDHVRRLTPLECERLQGFPDGWTDVPYARETQRYRQLGNAVAVPVAEWILRRIARAR